ncbi:MAG: rhombosortase [Gammaproteobacteria bacterium]|nr:MAG: rhombosortase [Gammaproteobacteria bacterium]
MLKKHSLPVALALISLSIQFSEPAQTLLRYDRAAIANGEIWRLLTGNLAHLNWPHLWLNLAGLLLIWLLTQHLFSTRQWGLAFLFTSLGVSSGLYIFDSELLWYVGLSGILHGLLVAPLTFNIRNNCLADHALLAIVLLKVIWEQFQGPMESSEALIEGQVVTDAHLFGAISGLVLGLSLYLLKRHKATKI